MNATLSPAERIARRRNYGTLYELALTHPDGRKLLVGYIGRLGRGGMFGALRKVGEAAVKVTGFEDITFGKRVADGARMGEWTLNTTGRTERDAIWHGELPWVGEAADPAPFNDRMDA